MTLALEMRPFEGLWLYPFSSSTPISRPVAGKKNPVILQTTTEDLTLGDIVVVVVVVSVVVFG